MSLANMQLADLQAAVYNETKRPDLITDTTNALVAALLKYHSIDFFWKDIATAQLQFEVSNYIQTIDTQQIPRFRAMAYLRKYDPTLVASANNPSLLPPLTFPWFSPDLAMGLLDPIAPDDLFDEWGCEKLDVYYGAGSTLMLKSSTQLQYVQIGWYQHPNVDTVTLANGVAGGNFGLGSFIMAEYPWLLVYEAASKIFGSIGQTESVRKYDDPNTGLIATHLNTMLRDNIVIQGR